jgi:archaemetzincin
MAGMGVILLRWMGEAPMDGGVLERIRGQVETVFAVPTHVQAVVGRPGDSLDSRRRQHSSTKILRWILASGPPAGAKVLGVTDVDLFIPVLTFVFGEAQLGGPAAVVSLARLRRTYDDRPVPEVMIEGRLLKECLHELGHTFGLAHCADAACVMSRSNSVLDVDRKRAVFCRDCRLRLRRLTEEAEGS